MRRESARKRGYTHRWEKARAVFLREHPLCVRCKRTGHTREATVVNHRIPHHGNQVLFWDVSNWEAVCKPCHDGPIQSFERGGRAYSDEIGVDGIPVDPSHPMRRG